MFTSTLVTVVRTALPGLIPVFLLKMAAALLGLLLIVQLLLVLLRQTPALAKATRAAYRAVRGGRSKAAARRTSPQAGRPLIPADATAECQEL